MRKIILASTSLSRKKVLEGSGLIFEVVPSDYEEDMTLNLEPGELAKFLSRGKAENVAKNFDNAIIISADTFALLDNKVIGKPRTVEYAHIMLRTLSGRTHTVITGFTIMDTKENKTISKVVETKVSFKELSDEMIHDYVKDGNTLRYAGSYTLNEIMNEFIEKIEGEHSNIIGLPIDAVMETLKEFNINE
jgi:septum formation protein